MYHLKPQLLLIAACAAIGSVSPAFAFGGNFTDNSDDRYIVDPDSPAFMSDTDQTYADPNQNFVLRGSVGIASIVAREKVFAQTSGERLLSLLVWDSTAPIVSGDAKVRFGDAWTLRGHIDAAMSGDSTMTDYDWIAPYATGTGMNDWSHRSISSNTSLDWYLNGDIAIGRDLPISDALTLNVNGGFKYTDVKWTAVGGNYIYSTGGFRNSVGAFPNIPGIDYRMQLPTAFLGLDANVKDGPWSLDTTTKAGVTVFASDVDNHRLRNIRFVDQLSFSQVYSINAKLGYDFNDHLTAFLEGSYEKMFAVHGNEDAYDAAAGTVTHYRNAIGADLDVATLKAGLKGQF